LSFNYAWCIW